MLTGVAEVALTVVGLIVAAVLVAAVEHTIK